MLETPSVEQSNFERHMHMVNSQIITIKNITGEDFVHPFAGMPYILPAGAEMKFSYPVGMHLAKHLVRKILTKEWKDKVEKDKSLRDVTMVHSDASIASLMSKIIVSTQEQPIQPQKTEGEIWKERTKEIQKEYDEVPSEVSEVTKADVVAELKKRGVKFDARSSLDDLKKLLIEDEAQVK